MPQEAPVLPTTIIDAIDTIMGYWGRDLRCQFANAAYQTWFGKSPHEMLGIEISEFLGPLYELTLPHILGALKGEAQVFERDLVLADGSIRHGLVSYYPDVAEGVVRGFSVHIVNITKTKRLEFALEECNMRAALLASHDFLTGLPNRFLLIERISALLLRAESSGGLVGVVSIKINRFQRINETYGYDEGDGVIREVARRMKSAIHPTETIIRMSGVEFLLLTTGIRSSKEVDFAIKRLLKAVQQPMQVGRQSFTPGLNFGIAVFPLNGKTASELLANADRALGQAKGIET